MGRTRLVAVVALLPLALCACGDEQEHDRAPERRGHGATAPPDAAAGAKVFAQAGCGNCHELKAAGSKGKTGPNLDEHLAGEAHEHAFDEIVERVTNGGRGMPAFRDRLSEKQIRDVATFVVHATRDRHDGS